ncbi:MAG: hypothetical protein K8J31_18965 [Anaerolineae bacterium]|nr:hypothetical protein [Anaerolineae bacterium]
MSKSIVMVLLILMAAGCGAPGAAELPTLAVLPTLTAAPEFAAPPRPLAFWQAAEGNLNRTAQVDRWQFSALAGDPIRLDVLGSVTLTLNAPNGRTLGEGPTIEARLPVDGVYTVMVQLSEGSSGRYQLGLGYTDRPNPADIPATPPPVTIGVPTPTPAYADLGLWIGDLDSSIPLTGTFLRGPVQLHVYTFAGRAGEYVNVRMTRITGTVDPALWLYGPDGDALAVDYDSGGNRAALLRNIFLRQDGLYSLQADGGGGPGDYQISLRVGERPVPVTPTIIAAPTATPRSVALDLTPATAVPDGMLEPYVPVIGSLIRPGDVNRHVFQASADDFVSIHVRKLQPDTRLRPIFEVFNPAGELIGGASARTSNAGGEALLQLLPIPETGTYSIFVRGEGGETGDYLISYGSGTIYENVPRGPAVADTPYDSQIAGRGLRDVWNVLLNAGDVITIAANPLNTALDPVVELYGPDGTLIASDDNSGGFPNALINQVTAPVSGLYHLDISSSGGGTVGSYRLIWRYINVAPTPTFDPPRILLFSVEETVSQGDYAFYPFQGAAGQRVRILVTAQVASGFDPVAVLIDPEGHELARGDDENGLNPQFTADLPADGTYQVRINGYLSGGTFSLVVERLF